METKHRIIFGDARSMSKINNETVHLVVTSPPYWQLKDYESRDQIGFDHNYEDYINNLNLAWMECHRVLYPGCRLCVNIGDQFARSVYYGRYKVIPIRTEITRFCETIGFDFMGSIIWQKVTTCNTTGGATIMGSFPYPRNGIVKIDYEFILLFKKHGTAPKVTKECKEQAKMTTEEWNTYFQGHWTFPGERQKGHLAMFPEELPRRLIRMFSFPGETVLDPFLGSGTSTLAAMKNGRHSLGYEISSAFEKTIRRRLDSANNLFSEVEVEYCSDKSRVDDKILEQLPYRFADPLKLDKKTDPRKLQFGSKIKTGDTSHRSLERVRDVLSFDRLRLSSGQDIRLMGISILPERRHDAIDFLNRKLKGQQVYLKFDAVKHDESNNLLAYVYLKNKTFINAHLVKHGFAMVDSSQPITNKSLLRYTER